MWLHKGYEGPKTQFQTKELARRTKSAASYKKYGGYSSAWGQKYVGGGLSKLKNWVSQDPTRLLGIASVGSDLLTGYYNDPTAYWRAARGAARLYRRSNYRSWQKRPYYRFKRIQPSRRYRRRQYYRSKRLPYWIWLRNKRRKTRYQRRYTTWNY